MLTISGITVRLGGRTILDRATASVPTGARVGLIGRNGAGKSTLMKVLIGELEPDEGEVDMPRRARLGYIAQEAPSGTATPFETVLAADAERAALLDEAEHCTDPDRLGDVHERLMALLDARFAAPAPALHLIAHPGAPPIESVVTRAAPSVLAIGPEGGWIERELETFVSRGFQAVSLGAPILRVEAAVASALGQLALLFRMTTAR